MFLSKLKVIRFSLFWRSSRTAFQSNKSKYGVVSFLDNKLTTYISYTSKNSSFIPSSPSLLVSSTYRSFACSSSSLLDRSNNPPVYYYIDIGGVISGGVVSNVITVGFLKQAVYDKLPVNLKLISMADELQVYLGKKEGKKWVKDGDALEPFYDLKAEEIYFIEVPEKKTGGAVEGKKIFDLIFCIYFID